MRVKALLLRQIPLNESSVDDIAHGLLGRVDLNLPLDEPTNAARRYIGLSPTDVQAALQQVAAARRPGARQRGPDAAVTRMFG